MSAIRSAFYSVFNNKCPRCHAGNFFIDNNPYILSKFDKMPKRCSICNEDFERETGFYYGAMFVSYALTVIFGILLFLLLCVAFDCTVVTYLIVFAIFQIILMPIFYRTSRLLWINVFVRYKKTTEITDTSKK